MGTQHAQRVVVKRNTCTEDTCNNTQRAGTQISGLYKHAQAVNKWNRMHVMSHTCITIWYVQVYCVLECVRICHYNDVHVHVRNNASVCTNVSRHERMHVHMCELKFV